MYKRTNNRTGKRNVKKMELRLEKDFGYFSDMWLSSVKNNVKQSTYVKYRNIIENHIKPQIGHINVNEIHTKTIENMCLRLSENGNMKTGGGLSAKSVRDILSVLRLVESYIKSSDIEIAFSAEAINIKSRRKNIRTFTYADQQKLTKYLMHNMNLIKLGILIALYTGLRIGELCALKFGDISVDEQVLRVRSTMQRLQNFSMGSEKKTEIIISSPKSETSLRDIPLPEFLTDILKDYNFPENAFLLTGDENRYIEPRLMENKFKKCLQDCEIEDTNFHQLRHRFATYCVELGFEIKCLSEILGHSSVNITLNRYVHSSMELKRSNMQKITLSHQAFD